MYTKNGICYTGKMEYSIRVTDVKPLKNLKMLVTFSTGEKRLFDASRLTGSAFEPLRDDKTFSSPSINHGVIIWKDGEIDIAPETVYEESISLPTPVPAYDEMTEDDFNQMLTKGLEQIERGETVSMEEVFRELDI